MRLSAVSPLDARRRALRVLTALFAEDTESQVHWAVPWSGVCPVPSHDKAPFEAMVSGAQGAPASREKDVSAVTAYCVALIVKL